MQNDEKSMTRLRNGVQSIECEFLSWFFDLEAKKAKLPMHSNWVGGITWLIDPHQSETKANPVHLWAHICGRGQFTLSSECGKWSLCEVAFAAVSRWDAVEEARSSLQLPEMKFILEKLILKIKPSAYRPTDWLWSNNYFNIKIKQWVGKIKNSHLHIYSKPLPCQDLVFPSSLLSQDSPCP